MRILVNARGRRRDGGREGGSERGKEGGRREGGETSPGSCFYYLIVTTEEAENRQWSFRGVVKTLNVGLIVQMEEEFNKNHGMVITERLTVHEFEKGTLSVWFLCFCF